MKKRASIAAVVAAAAPVPALAKKHRHVKGCNTISCDKRIGARWARKHPKAHASSFVARTGHGSRIQLLCPFRAVHHAYLRSLSEFSAPRGILFESSDD